MTTGVAFQRDAGIDYLESLDEAFELAANGPSGASDISLEIGGRTFRLRFGGDLLTRTLTPALSHHPILTVMPTGFTIYGLDAAATGIDLPPFPWVPPVVHERGGFWSFNTDRVRALYEPTGGTLSIVDLARGHAFVAVEDARRLRGWHRSAPLRAILRWLFASPTRLLAHAAAVGIGREGVLLAGGAGAGKSTTAVACAAAGLQYAGDDYVLLENAPLPTAHSLYATAKLTEVSLAMLPPLGQAVWPGSLEDEKRVIDIAQAFPLSITRALGVRAIVLPRVTPGGPTRVKRVTAVDAVRALAPSTIYQVPRNGGRELSQIADLARRVPAYSLAIDDPASAASAISELLQDRD